MDREPLVDVISGLVIGFVIGFALGCAFTAFVLTWKP